MKTILTMALAALTMIGLAHAGNEGGGGGGICVNGRCLTLAEAGVRLKEYEGSWKPTKEIREELSTIIKQLPFAAVEVIALSLGEDKTFQEVESVKPKMMNVIRADYINILKNSGMAYDEKDLEIFAISNGSRTYLLPSFFKLSTKRQALLLIHEGIVRRFNNNHRFALIFDGQLLDYLERREDSSYSALEFFRNLAKISRKEGIANSHLLKYTEEKLGRKLGMGDFTDGYNSNGSMTGTGLLKDLAPEALWKNQTQFPEFFDIFAKARVYEHKIFAERLMYFDEKDYQHYKQLCEETQDRFKKVLLSSVTQNYYGISASYVYSQLRFLVCHTLTAKTKESDSSVYLDVLHIGDF